MFSEQTFQLSMLFFDVAVKLLSEIIGLHNKLELKSFGHIVV